MKLLSTSLLMSFLFVACKPAVNSPAPKEANDTNTPLHLVQPDYPVPYGIPDTAVIVAKLQAIYNYLNGVTPFGFVNNKTGEKVSDLTMMDEHTSIEKGDFRIVSYEWGVTYGAMLKASEVTNDDRYKKYSEDRLQFIAESSPYFSKLENKKDFDWGAKGPLKNLLHPHALDDCGAMCSAMLKYKNAGSAINFDALTDIHIDYIMNKEHRLADGNLARNRPQPNSLWLDDMYMALPALAQKGKSTGDISYYNEATKQTKLFASKMFNKEKQVFMHGWVEGMDVHPQFHWARANGWAILTLTEILDVLPSDHTDRPYILELLRSHLQGLSRYQDGTGFWHQLLDRNDTYLETSATAIYAYCFSHAINEGWIDKKAYAPLALLAWNALSTKINDAGQVEGTCVGTGMGFEPAFYFYRPISKFAAHGYGPAILATSEILRMVKKFDFEINDSAVQLLKAK